MTNPAAHPRFDGLDLARALAIAGMAAVHFGPTAADGLTGALYALPHGRAAVLFMVVAGMGVALLARSRTASEYHLTALLGWRALLLFPLGLALQTAVSAQYIILQTYGLLFLLAPLLLRLRDRHLGAVAIASALIGTTAFLAGRIHAPSTFDRAPIELGTGGGDMLHGLLLSGPYPLMVWLAPFALGLWLGRKDLTDPLVQQRLALAGAATALAAALVTSGMQGLLAGPSAPEVEGITTDLAPATSWLDAFSLEAHSQMPLWLISACGIAVALVGLAGMVAHAWRERLWPLIALGQTALTFYVAHLLALAIWPDVLTAEQPAGGLALPLVALGVGMLFAVTWLRYQRRGPLESLLRPPRVWPFGRRST